MSGENYPKEPPPPSYAESQNYPQFGSEAPGPTYTQSIFTYGVTPSPPLVPSAPAPVPRTEPPPPPSYHPPPQPVPEPTQYSSQSFAQYGTPAAGFSSYAQNYGPSPAAPIQAGYQAALPYGPQTGSTPTGVVYNPVQGTAQSYSVPPDGYTTTPLAYGNIGQIGTTQRQRQKKIAIFVCVFILIMVITMVIFFTMFL